MTVKPEIKVGQEWYCQNYGKVTILRITTLAKDTYPVIGLYEYAGKSYTCIWNKQGRDYTDSHAGSLDCLWEDRPKSQEETNKDALKQARYEANYLIGCVAPCGSAYETALRLTKELNKIKL